MNNNDDNDNNNDTNNNDTNNNDTNNNDTNNNNTNNNDTNDVVWLNLYPIPGATAGDSPTLNSIPSSVIVCTAEKAEQVKNQCEVSPIRAYQVFVDSPAKVIWVDSNSQNGHQTEDIAKWLGLDLLQYLPEVMKEPVVAVIDSGVPKNLPPQCRVEGTKKYLNSLSFDDQSGHATHVSGIIYSLFPNAKFLFYKATDDEGRTSTGALIDGISWALSVEENKPPADIINVSIALGSKYCPEILTDFRLKQLKKTFQHTKAFIFCSTGNFKNEPPGFPALLWQEKGWERLFSVGALDGNRKWEKNSNGVQIYCPGVNIRSRDMTKSGTSQAAAIASGLSTLLVSRNILGVQFFHNVFWFGHKLLLQAPGMTNWNATTLLVSFILQLFFYIGMFCFFIFIIFFL